LEKEAATALLQLARPAITQRDSATPVTAVAPQSASGDTHALMTSADGHAHPPPTTVDSVTPASAGTLASADSQHLAEMRSAILAPGLMITADSHTQPPPPPTAASVNPSAVSAPAQSTVIAPNAHSFALSADTQHAALSAPDSLMTDYPRTLLPVMSVPGAINHPHRQSTDSALVSALAPSMTDYTLLSTMSDMTAATGPPRVPPPHLHCFLVLP